MGIHVVAKHGVCPDGCLEPRGNKFWSSVTQHNSGPVHLEGDSSYAWTPVRQHHSTLFPVSCTLKAPQNRSWLFCPLWSFRIGAYCTADRLSLSINGYISNSLKLAVQTLCNFGPTHSVHIFLPLCLCFPLLDSSVECRGHELQDNNSLTQILQV